MSFPLVALELDSGDTCAYCPSTAVWGVFGADDVAHVQTDAAENGEKVRHLLYRDGIGVQVCTQCLQKLIGKKKGGEA